MIKLFNVKWKCITAGPSPLNNQRTEVFLLGCNKAISGNPCKGCFNSMTWDVSRATVEHDPVDMANNILKFSPNKYITFGGGEPTDQIDDLLIVFDLLKKQDFHILMYTWRDLKFALNEGYGEALKNKLHKLLNYVDIIIDGEFVLEERIFNEEMKDGCYNSIGSKNQIVWDIKNKIGYAMKDIQSLTLNQKNELIYKTFDNPTKLILQ